MAGALAQWAARRQLPLLFLAVLAILAANPRAMFADEMIYKCERGRPHYCLKYGQGVCTKTNSLANKAQACEQWTEACVDCQTAIDNCFERSPEPVLQGSAECTACRAELQTCMAAIDSKYWPNR